MNKRDESRESPVSVDSVDGDSDCIYRKMISLSLLTEIFTTSDQLCKKFPRRELLFLGMVPSESFGIQDYQSFRRSRGL